MSSFMHPMRATAGHSLWALARRSLDVGWGIEFIGATISWLCNEPAIAVLALAVKGGLLIYCYYLKRLSARHRSRHLFIRNTVVISGILLALPLLGGTTLLQWLATALLGALLAWLLLLVTGSLKRSSPKGVHHVF